MESHHRITKTRPFPFVGLHSFYFSKIFKSYAFSLISKFLFQISLEKEDPYTVTCSALGGTPKPEITAIIGIPAQRHQAGQ